MYKVTALKEWLLTMCFCDSISYFLNKDRSSAAQFRWKTCMYKKGSRTWYQHGAHKGAESPTWRGRAQNCHESCDIPWQTLDDPNEDRQMVWSERPQQVIIAELNMKSSSDFQFWTSGPPPAFDDLQNSLVNQKGGFASYHYCRATSTDVATPTSRCKSPLHMHTGHREVKSINRRWCRGHDILQKRHLLEGNDVRDATVACPRWTGLLPMEDSAGETRHPQQGKQRPWVSPSPRLSPKMSPNTWSGQDPRS